MKVLIAGWFSFEYMGATAGDLIARDMVGEWLAEAGISFDIALSPAFEGGIRWEATDPGQYSDVIFVCGPFGNGWPVTEFLTRFSGARLVGLNLTMLQPLDEWNPFDILFERDSSRTSNPDLTLAAPPPKTPVVGIILAHKQKEYGERALHEQANAAIQQLVQSREMAVVPIDTALENNAGGLRTPGEVESLIARMDLVLTTRLHGTVLALKNGVPPIPIDPIVGGAKITRQVKTLGWSLLFWADQLEMEALSAAFDYCLTSTARQEAQRCARRAVGQIEVIRRSVIDQMAALASK